MFAVDANGRNVLIFLAVLATLILFVFVIALCKSAATYSERFDEGFHDDHPTHPRRST